MSVMTKEKREAYKEKLDAEIKYWDSKLDELKAKEKKADAESRLKILERISDLESWKDNLKARLGAVKEKGEEVWDNFKQETDEFIDRMKTKFRNM